MIKKFKLWLIEQVLPIWARDQLMKENERLNEEIRKLRVTIAEKDAYIEGLEHGIRAQRRIVINAGEVKK